VVDGAASCRPNRRGVARHSGELLRASVSVNRRVGMDLLFFLLGTVWGGRRVVVVT
jgi:hypothetical protein